MRLDVEDALRFELEYWRERDPVGREYWVSRPVRYIPRYQPGQCFYDPDLS